MSWDSGSAGFIGAGRSSTGFLADAVFDQMLDVGDNRYNHAGGGQMLGDYFFVGLEGGSDLNGAVGIWRAVTSTSTPAMVSLEATGGNVWLVMPAGVNGAGQVAAVKLQPFPGESASRYAIIVGGPRGTVNLYFFISDPGASLTNGAAQFHLSGVLPLNSGDTWLNGWNDYQNINLVTDCADGQLYLVTLSRDGASGDGIFPNCSNNPFGGYGGDDYVKIFRVDMTFDPMTGLLEDFSIGTAPLAQQHMFCHDTCNFDAGAGVYVGPGGSLNVYATEHDNDGPNGSVKMREYAQP